MLESTKIDIPSLGPVFFKRSERAKHLSITVKHDRTIRVTIPKGASLTTARRFLSSRIQWVSKHLNKLKELELKHAQRDLRPVRKERARTILTARLDCLARKHGFVYNRLFIREQKTKWGSCSDRNNINLNIRLAALPRELMDYVILHELVHTRHRNHSRKFWACLDKLVKDAKKLQKRLNEYALRTV